MGEYVININWNGGNGSGNSKGNTTPTAFLAGATTAAAASLLPDTTLTEVFDENSVIPDTFYGVNNIQDGEGQITKEWKKIKQGQVLNHTKNFLWNTKRIGTKTGVAYGNYKSFRRIPKTAWNWSEEEKLRITTIHSRTIAYTAAQAIRLINLGVSTHYQYASAIASSTAELNAVNDYENAMTGIGLVGSIAAGTAVGAKVGAVGGPVGTAIGAGIGAAVAITNKAVST